MQPSAIARHFTRPRCNPPLLKDKGGVDGDHRAVDGLLWGRVAPVFPSFDYRSATDLRSRTSREDHVVVEEAERPFRGEADDVDGDVLSASAGGQSQDVVGEEQAELEMPMPHALAKKKRTGLAVALSRVRPCRPHWLATHE